MEQQLIDLKKKITELTVNLFWEKWDGGAYDHYKSENYEHKKWYRWEIQKTIDEAGLKVIELLDRDFKEQLVNYVGIDKCIEARELECEEGEELDIDDLVYNFLFPNSNIFGDIRPYPSVYEIEANL